MQCSRLGRYPVAAIASKARHESFPGLPDLLQEPVPVPHEERRGCRQRIRLPLDHHGEVEQITRRRTVPTVVHLLGDHLPGRLDAHRPPWISHHPTPRR